MHVGDASASALATALVLGALPRLKVLTLRDPKGMSRSRTAPSAHAIGDAGLVPGGPRAGLAGVARAGDAQFHGQPARRRGHRRIAALWWRRRRRQVHRRWLLQG